MCEAAQDWGRAPSSYLVAPGAASPDVAARDRVLEIAYTTYKHGLCPHCGYPREVCGTEERFKAEQGFCHAKAAVEQAEHDEQESRKGSKAAPEFGKLFYPVYQEPVEI